MTLTIELPEALAELVRAHGETRSLTDAEAVQDLLRERFMPIDMDEVEASLLDPAPGEPIPLTREYIEELKEYARSIRQQAAAG